uniref:Uncharacterized protein n=1 Tax=Zea mays TaxID=4577 RepID=C0PCD0_MAIZE|nr:unknown [Zea mays]ACR38329.1 unknown [Zea mays]
MSAPATARPQRRSVDHASSLSPTRHAAHALSVHYLYKVKAGWVNFHSTCSWRSCTSTWWARTRARSSSPTRRASATPATCTPQRTCPWRGSTPPWPRRPPSTSSPSRRPSTGSTSRASTRRPAPCCAPATACSPPGATPSHASTPPSTPCSGACTTGPRDSGRPTAGWSTTSTGAPTSRSTRSRGRSTRARSSSPRTAGWTSMTTSCISRPGPPTRLPRITASSCSMRPPSRSSRRRGAAMPRR